MKLLIREYFASLKERGELDAVLPDLLSELGFTVYSRPRLGAAQRGVDIAAVGKDVDNEEKVFLFSIKQGDLSRQDWDASAPRGLRPSLNEILDGYIPARIPPEYKELKIVICICVGGEIRESIRDLVSGFTTQNTTDRVSFAEWNGDKLAGLLQHGILREEILPKNLRSSFQKSVAMVDEPVVSYEHFSSLVGQLRSTANENDAKTRLRVARQFYICLWILFVWARDVSNIEAPYRASELTILALWDIIRRVEKNDSERESLVSVLHELINLHEVISTEFFESRIFPHARKRDGLALAVATRASVDVNLKLFDCLGRLAMTGLWLRWALPTMDEEAKLAAQNKIERWGEAGFHMIGNNQALLLPIADEQAIEVALFLFFVVGDKRVRAVSEQWLEQMADRFDFTLRTNGRYPAVFTEYRDLLEHPRDQTDEYREDATAGSVLLPLLAAWLSAFKNTEALKKLSELKESKLQHCNLQLWLPDESTEDQLYQGRLDHGVSLGDLPLSETGAELLDTIDAGCKRQNSLEKLSAIEAGYWPIVLMACRHFRLPVPPHFWINLLRPNPTNASPEV